MNTNDIDKQPVIAVLGLGYVGCVTAACIAHLGYDVTGVDPDEFKVRSIQQGKAPFYEPQLPDLVKSACAAGRLRGTTSLADGLETADIALICVGTPSERSGNLSLHTLRKVCEDIGHLLPARSKRLIVVIRSTVFPGTCEEVVLPALGSSDKVCVVVNPEFLREGAAVRDFMEPSLVVVGGSEVSAVTEVAQIYESLGVPPCLVSLRTAEMIKYTCNAFHAVKIGFANEIGALCGTMGVSPDEVMDTVCRDFRLNISPAYLKPGFAFGGSCLPKDLRALTYRAARLDLRLPMLQSVLPSNEEHLRRACERVLDQQGNLGVFGLAFKENTDDVRESPTIAMIEFLIGKGRNVRIFDPHIQLESIYGSNRSFLLSAIPHIGKLMAPDLAWMLRWADTVVVAQKPSPLFRSALEHSGLPTVDLVGTGIGAGALAMSAAAH